MLKGKFSFLTSSMNRSRRTLAFRRAGLVLPSGYSFLSIRYRRCQSAIDGDGNAHRPTAFHLASVDDEYEIYMVGIDMGDKANLPARAGATSVSTRRRSPHCRFTGGLATSS